MTHQTQQMPNRPLGKSGLTAPAIALGCGNVGGLFTVDSTTDEQTEAVKRAWELGVTWFDTAPQYGNGNSEKNLGWALREAGVFREAQISTKVRVPEEGLRDIPGAIMRSAEASLTRLGVDKVALFQLHNRITEIRGTQQEALGMWDVLGNPGVLETMERLRREGMCQAIGITALGDAQALKTVVLSGGFHTAQVYYNLLNPTAGHPKPSGLFVHDYKELLNDAYEMKMGVLAIRVLAAGALADQPVRSEMAGQALSPGSAFGEDRRRAAALRPLAQEIETSLARAAVRFAAHDERVTAVLVGASDAGQIEEAVEAVRGGPLPEEFMRQWRTLLESDFRPK
jgi:L-galactose dehydrogenase/L-glyceraldehyde 3-phosphate reductase